MNVEENRLQTYQTWPENAPVHPSQLAREGFFATENFLETECFSCRKRIDNWQYGDMITTRHFQLNPECDFLTNPSDSGNLPMQQQGSDTSQQFNSVPVASVATATTSASASLDLTQLDLKIEANRLATFVNWPNPNITPQALAKAGFYYLNRSDQVRCAWCKGVVAKWEKEDNAFEEHQRFFPECPRVLLGPLIEIASDGIRDLGIQQISPPKRPKFSSLDARLRTYSNWPISDIQRPEALAQAGLYYHDIDDQVRCFHCFIGLRSWQKEDDPWFEHAKWYPQCQFVRLVKGANYVQQVQEMTRQTAAQQPAAETCEDLALHLPATNIEEAMESTPVLQALEIGIDVGAIRTVTQRRLALTGRPYDTVENLLKAVFGDPDDDSNDNDDDDDYGYNRYAETESGALDTISQRIRRLTQIGASTSATGLSGTTTEPPNCVASTGSDVPPRYSNFLAEADRVPQNSTLPTSSNASESLRDEKPKTTTAEHIKNAQDAVESTPHRNIALEEENRKLKDARLCKVCLDEEVGVVFLPCGHLVTCVQCAPGVNQCPMCRTVIKGFVRTFLS